MAEQCQKLIELQRSEFNTAARLQYRILYVQVAIAFLAALTVFLTNDLAAYCAAVLTLIAAAGWALLNWKYKESRALAERVRRATLVMEGLGQQMSIDEYRDILTRFSKKILQETRDPDPDYYATKSPAGYGKLAEMLEESVFWSSFLLRRSAERTWWISLLFLAIAGILFLGSMPFLGSHQLLSSVRVICSVLILAVSTDILGAALAYSGAAAVTQQIVTRLHRSKLAGYPLHDLLVILGDYNSAVEGAPMFARGIYETHQDELSRIWNER